MAKRQILRMGHPLLRKRSREVSPTEIISKPMRKLIDELVETMHAAEGVGIAAPQVGELIRLSVIEFEDDNDRYPDTGNQKLTVFFNPVLKVLDTGVQSYWEGCLSVPGLRGLVERPRKVEVQYLDEKAEPQSLIAEGFLATVVQHEFDHLDGTLYVDRVKDTTQLAYIEEYSQFILPHTDKGEID